MSNQDDLHVVIYTLLLIDFGSVLETLELPLPATILLFRISKFYSIGVFGFLISRQILTTWTDFCDVTLP
ncbi:MAG: hypothetical protein AAFO91_20045, partial [Bacteroidota bacterium]